MKVYACGNCGGALEVKGSQESMVCPYCGYTNEKTDLENELSKFKKEVAGWLRTIGAAGGTSTDVGMRKLYFADSVYPSLLTEFSNLIGDTEDVLDFPLCYFKVFGNIPDLKIQTKWNPEQGKPMKEFARKLDSSSLANFAPDPESQLLLHELKLRSLSVPMLMDTVSLAENPTVENLRHCSYSLDKLASEASSVAEVASKNPDSPASYTYYSLLADRLKLASESYAEFAGAIESRSQISDEWLEDQKSRIGVVQSSLKDLEGLSVTDRVSLESGLENDSNVVSAISSLVNLYSQMKATNFPMYMEAIESLTNRTLFVSPPEDIEHLSWFTFDMDSKKLSWFLSSLNTTINRKFYRVLAGQNDISSWVSKKKNASGFFLYPFYISKVKTILKSGFLLWKKGNEEEFVSLCDAAFNLYPGFPHGDFPSMMTPGFKKMVGSKREQLMLQLLNTGAVELPKGWTALPPTVTPENVEALYAAAHNLLEEREISAAEGGTVQIPPSYRKMGFDPGKVKALSAKVIDLVYLPMVLIGSETEVYGKHFGLECRLPHRAHLVNAFTDFKKVVSQ
ncbi:MAG: hypothetical protein ACTSV3_06090 [Candidatus Thorarchaeota archaeon]|nr:MAG: hypothetical protein DRP09_14000 [Candidatus Thorarchaeota archaeon]RLI58732.1 MAG: hypothetical protein DRO87_04930 [Candidatus Thorarchaeota archaeon]